MKSRSRGDPLYQTLDLDPLDPRLFVTRVSAHIEDPADFLDLVSDTVEGQLVQAVDTRWIIGPRHLRAAAINTLLGEMSGTSWIREPALRMLAYLSLETQVRKALAKAGVKVGREQDVMICSVVSEEIPPRGLFEAVESLKNASPQRPPFPRRDETRTTEMAEQFGIPVHLLHQEPAGDRTDLLTDLVLERMALLPMDS